MTSLSVTSMSDPMTNVEDHVLFVDVPDNWTGSPTLVWIDITHGSYQIVGETKAALQKFGCTKAGDGLKDWEWMDNSLDKLILMIVCFIHEFPLDHSHENFPVFEFIPAARFVVATCSIRPVCFIPVDEGGQRVLMLEFTSVKVRRCKKKAQRKQLNTVSDDAKRVRSKTIGQDMDLVKAAGVKARL